MFKFAPSGVHFCASHLLKKRSSSNIWTQLSRGFTQCLGVVNGLKFANLGLDKISKFEIIRAGNEINRSIL